MLNEYAMSHVRYYQLLTGGDSRTDVYTSSIWGLTFWALHYGFVDVPAALTRSGYSAKALSGFGKNG
jgi:hypothetical protein